MAPIAILFLWTSHEFWQRVKFVSVEVVFEVVVTMTPLLAVVAIDLARLAWAQRGPWWGLVIPAHVVASIAMLISLYFFVFWFHAYVASGVAIGIAICWVIRRVIRAT